MTKPNKSISIGAAKCAHRTGLTVRALRVYERHGLIEPTRSAKGWRQYGQRELARLNAIVTLKAFGLTLNQIRSYLTASPPELARVFELQLQVWASRKAAAEKGLKLVQAALSRIEARNRLSIEELCDLARSMDMSNQQETITRSMINEAITPDEERAYLTWWAARSPGEAIAMREYGSQVRVVFQSLHSFFENGAAPASAEVQALVDQWKALALRYRLRNTMIDLLEWNAPIARKWLEVGEHSVSRAFSSESGKGLWGYFAAAVAASKWNQTLIRIADEAANLVEKKAKPSSAMAKALIERLAQTCSDFSLGDPAVYARWSTAMRRDDRSAPGGARRTRGWQFLTSAIPSRE
jgi:DNA-binding transcriptional MerR regulator